MERGKTMERNKKKHVAGKRMKRVIAFALAAMMVINVPTQVEAFSFGKLVKKVTSSVTSAVKKLVDTSDSKTVYSYSELKSYTASVFTPKDIKITLGKDITVPSNSCIGAVWHNVDLNLNGHTIYSDNPGYAVLIGYGLKYKIHDGQFVQRTNTSTAIINMSSGDLTMKNVTFKKSGSATNVTGFEITGVLADPKATLDNVTFDGMKTGVNITFGARMTINNSLIKNSQGDAITMPSNQFAKGKSILEINNSSIKYSKGNGINLGGNMAQATLNNVTITGGTNRNRYGILAKEGAIVNLKGNSKVYANAGGNIGVYKGSPVNIEQLTSNNKYSFTVIDGLNGTSAETVAKLNTAFSGSIRSLPAYSDISRYMVLGNENKKEIKIQNPPEQCVATAEVAWNSGTKELADKDDDYATVSMNGSEEAKTGNVTVKYDTKVTLSTTNKNPQRYKFLGWYKTADGNKEELISDKAVCQVDVIDANVTYKAKYQYMQYTIKTLTSGKGSVSITGGIPDGNKYYVDDEVTLKATPQAADDTATYKFSKWNNGKTEATLYITVSKDETYTAMFKKATSKQGTMYLGVEEITDLNQIRSGNKLLLVYIGAVGNAQDNKLEASSGNLGITGIPAFSAKLIAGSSTVSHSRTQTDKNTYLGKDGVVSYGYNANPVNHEMVKVTLEGDAGKGFDSCKEGYVGRYTFTNPAGQRETSWLYWCDRGGVKAVGPYALYSYTKTVDFNPQDVVTEMKDGFRPSADGDTINKDKLSVTVDVNGTKYELGGLKFSGDDLDDKINYAEGDKLINFELDGVTVDYNFPEATINGKQYEKLSEAIAAAGETDTIKIVGPGVDSIDVTSPVKLKEGAKIEGYDGENVTACAASEIGVDKDGTVRLTKGTLDVTPPAAGTTEVGVKDAFAITDKEITVTTDENGNVSVITPKEAGTNLKISPDNDPSHLVEIENVGGDGKQYGFDNIPSYSGETVKISPETEYTINVPNGKDGKTEIKSSKYNTGTTTITEKDGMPEISSSKEGDKITVGDKTYTAGKPSENGFVKYRVNPNPDEVPSIELEEGTVGIPNGSSIKANGQVIENTGVNSVQVSENGTIEIPDNGTVKIGDTEIAVPAKTPMNGNTTVTLDENGKPNIKTTGNSTVTIKVNGEEITYQVGDYDCELTIGEDGIPVIENGEIKLQPGQIVKDRLGNTYRCPEDATEGITIMTTPLVYETDDDGNQLVDEDGNPILVGGGDMSFVIPENKSIECQPAGSDTFIAFENPGQGEGFFNLDPEKAEAGIEADSELGLAPGKELQVNTGNKNVSVKAPETGNNGTITVDGSNGNITLSKNGDKVLIDGKTYTATSDDTIFVVGEDGVSLSKGSASINGDAEINIGSVKIEGPASDDQNIEISVGDSSVEAGTTGTTIKAADKTEFSITPIGGNKGDRIDFISGEGENEYAVGMDGSISLPAGKTITKKGNPNTKIEAGNNEISLKPLPEPDANEVENKEVSPAHGLLIEVPKSGEVTIDGKTYKESAVRKDQEADSGEENKLPMQLVVEDTGDVFLYDGTVGLEKGADVTLYDVDNKKTKFRNTSEGDETIQVTNPGIVTMQKGASVTMESGKNKTELTSTEDDTQLVYTSEVCMLKRGGVNLDPDERILVQDIVVKNTSSKGDITVSMKEEKKEGEESGFKYTGTITVPDGSSFEVAAIGADKGIAYKSNVEGASGGQTEFTINEDGNIVMPKDSIAVVTGASGKQTEIQAGVGNIESVPTQDGGVMVAIPAGGSIVVDGVRYTNSSSDASLVLSINPDGQVILERGKVELTEGTIVYVKNEENVLVPIKNDTQTESGGTSAPIKVSYDGITESTNDKGEVTGTTYPDVKVEIPTGNTIGIGNNSYTADQAAAEKSDVELSMDIKKKEEGIPAVESISGDRILLESGTVALNQNSSISVKVPGSETEKKVLENLGGENDNSIQIDDKANVKLPTGSSANVISKDGTTKIEVPAVSEEQDDYQVKIDLGKTDGKLNVDVKTKDGTGNTGAGKTVKINDGTYTSNESGKDLGLTINQKNDNEVSLSEGNASVDLSTGASLKVGDTTVTAKEDAEEKVKVTETTDTDGTTKLPKVDIPAGGQANFKNPKNNQDIDVKVPDKTEGEGSQQDGQTINVTPDGKLSTDLKKDDKIVIGGIEYTGTSEDNTKNNTITVNGETGKLENAGSGEAEAAPSVSIKLDPEQFNKPGYKYTIPAGSSVSVNGVDYKAPAESGDIELSGNPDGYPIIEIKNADGTIEIGGKTYTAGNANTKFTVDASGKITLMDNGNADANANSSIKFGGSDAEAVNGVTYHGDSNEDEYTITYKEGGCSVKPKDGTRLSVDIPKDGKIYVEGKSAVKAKDDKGKDVTVSCENPLLIQMDGESGNIVLDKTVEGETDTAYVSVTTRGNVEFGYTGEEESKKITSITVKKKETSSQPGGSSDTNVKDETGTKGNITIKDNKTGKDIEIPAEVKEDKIVIKDIPEKTLDQIVRADAEGKTSLVLDCSSINKNKVELKTDTMKALASKADEINIITIGAEVTLDHTAANAIIEQASGNTIEIKVSKEKMTELLNDKQQTAIEEYNVRACLDAYVESNGVRISDFKTGVVKVGIPWVIANGTKAVYYHVYYLTETGEMEFFDTSYENGKLYFKTTHFSEYVIVYDEDMLNSTPIDQSPLLAKCTKTTKKSIRIKWNKVDTAKKYEVYVAQCNSKGKKYSLKKVATVDGNTTSYVAKGLKKGTVYKIMVKAVNGKKCIKKSKVLHVTTTGGKYTNSSKITAKKSKITLVKGKTTVIKTSYKNAKNAIVHVSAVRYVTSNKEVATVNKEGKVTAQHKGTCKVYALLNNGEYVTIQVTVK